MTEMILDGGSESITSSSSGVGEAHAMSDGSYTHDFRWQCVSKQFFSPRLDLSIWKWHIHWMTKRNLKGMDI